MNDLRQQLVEEKQKRIMQSQRLKDMQDEKDDLTEEALAQKEDIERLITEHDAHTQASLRHQRNIRELREEVEVKETRG